jgi:hypothetical protein
MGEKRNGYKLLMGNPEVNRPLGRPRHRWVYLGGIRWSHMDWIYLALVNEVMNLRVP